MGIGSILARQYGQVADGTPSFGMGVVHRDKTTYGPTSTPTEARYLFGCDGFYGGGPIFTGERMGNFSDYHKLGVTNEGNDICASKIHTLALFHMPNSSRGELFKDNYLLGSGPIYFEEDFYPYPAKRPFTARTHLVYDFDFEYFHRAYGTKRGMWRFWTEASTAGSDEPPPETPGDPVPPTTPGDVPPPPKDPPHDVPDAPVSGSGVQPQPEEGPKPAPPPPPERKTVTNRNPDEPHEGYYQTPLTHAWSSQLLKARYTKPDQPDLHDYKKDWEGKDMELYDWTFEAPIIVRKDAVSGHSCPWTDYTQPHNHYGDNPGGRFLSGTKSGMELIYPPEIDILQVRNVKDSGGTKPQEYTNNEISIFWETFLPRERLAFGWPDLDNDEMYQGYDVYWDDSNDHLVFNVTDPSGNSGTVMTLPGDDTKTVDFSVGVTINGDDVKVNNDQTRFFPAFQTVAAGGTGTFYFDLPDDVDSITSLVLVAVPGSGTGSTLRRITYSTEYGDVTSGESHTNHTETSVSIDYDWTGEVSNLQELDINSATVFQNVDASDICKLTAVTAAGIGGSVNFYGVRLTYTPSN